MTGSSFLPVSDYQAPMVWTTVCADDPSRRCEGKSMGGWAAIASTLIAVVGLFFTGAQLLVMNRAAAMERRVAREGVVVSWEPVEAPRAAEPDGTGVWEYEIQVQNPGALPVDNLRVDWHFRLPVQRRRQGHLDPPTTHLELVQPVLPGGGHRVCAAGWS